MNDVRCTMCTTSILGARRLAPPNNLIPPMLNHAYALHEIYDDDQQHESHDHDAHHPPDADGAPIISSFYHDIDTDPIEMSDDAAGLMVVLYLLLISTLFISTLTGGLFIVIQYGFVVLVAVVVVVFCMFVVAAVVMNAVAQEKTLMRAKTKINRWHDIVKDEILKEIDNLKADVAAYNSGHLLLLTSIDHDGGVGSTSSNEGGGDCVHDETNVNSASKTKRKLHAPKSILFRALSLTSLTKTSNNNDDRRKTIFWRRKKKGNSTVTVKESTNECYDSPSIV